jgi:hypothetical protein
VVSGVLRIPDGVIRHVATHGGASTIGKQQSPPPPVHVPSEPSGERGYSPSNRRSRDEEED